MEYCIENISLSELIETEGLSVRTQNICLYFNFKNIYSIFDYYRENGDFIKLRNCGKRSNLELVNICKKYEGEISQPKEEIIHEFQIYPITESIHSLLKQRPLVKNVIESSIKELSVRSLNVLKSCLGSNFDILDLKQILSISKSDLKDLHNIGEKSIEEIRIFLSTIQEPIQRLLSIENQISNIKLKNKTNSILNKSNLLDTKRVKLINDFIAARIICLSDGSRTALSTFLDNNIILENFDTIIYSNPEFKTELIQDVGDISKNEIQSFLSTIKEYIEFVSGLCEYDVQYAIFNLFVRQRFSLKNNVSLDILLDHNKTSGLPIFKFIDVLIENGNILNDFEKAIFYNEYCETHSASEVLSAISPVIDRVTRERIRKLRVKSIQKFIQKFNFISRSEIKSLVNYSLDLTGNYLEITNDLINDINKCEKTNFNRSFITKIIAILYSNKYDLISKVAYKKTYKNSNSNNLHCGYIVDKQITSILDFDSLIDDFKKRVKGRIQEDYTLHFQSYLLRFRKSRDFEISDIITETAKYVLFSEFGLSVDIFGNINIKRTSVKQFYKYSYEALEQLGKPSQVRDIYSKVTELYPDCKGNQNSIRSSMKRKNGFVPIGRSSIFGLKKWESISENFKDGTVPDIV